MDANAAQEYAALMRQATDIVRPSDAEADEREVEALKAWAESLNLDAQITRELDEGGCVIWHLEIDAGRGKWTLALPNVEDWRAIVKGMGLA